MEHVIVPLAFFALVFGIPITAIVMESRNKRSRDRLLEKAIEAGMDPEQVQRSLPKEPTRGDRHRPYSRGLALIAIGAALLVVRQVGLVDAETEFAGISVYPGAAEEAGFGFLIGGLITLFLGISMLLSDFLNRGERRPTRAPGDDPE
jgi:hypothetical protein